MRELEALIVLVLAAVVLAAAARRVGAPYPVFLAIGGAILAFVPGAPSFTVLPELALALFVAPVLLDAAFDASPRDLRDNWAPVTSLVVFGVGLTTIAVAAVARTLMPAMPWAAAIALGAVVAPPAHGHHSSVRRHVWRLDTRRSDRSFGCAHHGVLRRYRGADRARANPRAGAHTVLRRVGDGRLHAERARLHVHRPANPSDSGE